MQNTCWPLRRWSRALRTLPDFVILGTQKGGTSSLYQALTRHPQVLPPACKEVHYFDHHAQQALHWYRMHFPLQAVMRGYQQAFGRAITGEASPYYLFHPHVPRRLAETLPRVRLIVLLRNPVERAYSHYRHNRRKGREPLSFSEAVACEDERLSGEYKRMLHDPLYKSYRHQHFSYVHRGIYVDQLEAYHRFFERRQMLVIRSETFFRAPSDVLRRVFSFLGLPAKKTIRVHRYNAGAYSSGINPEMRERLRQRFAPHNERLREYLDADLAW